MRRLRASVDSAGPVALFSDGVGNTMELWLSWVLWGLSVIPLDVEFVNAW